MGFSSGRDSEQESLAGSHAPTECDVLDLTAARREAECTTTHRTMAYDDREKQKN